MPMNKGNSRVFMVLLSVIMLAGFWLIVSAPGRIAEKSLVSARQMVADEQSAVDQFSGEFWVVADWYKPEYSTPIADLIQTGQDQLYHASAKVESSARAKSSKDKKADASEAKESVRAAEQAISEAKSSLAAMEKTAEDARNLLGQMMATIDGAKRSFGVATDRLTNEGGRYLSKYVVLNNQELDKASIALQEADINFEKALGLLPNSTEKERSADPRQALDLLTTASKAAGSADSSIQAVTKNLNFYSQAEVKATETTKNAQQTILLANNHLGDLVSQGPLSADKALKQPYANIRQAEQSFAVANGALAAVVEQNKYDFPLAYGSSLEAINLAGGASQEADRQMALASQVKKDSESLNSAIADFQNSIDRSRQDRDKLSHHAESVWSSVANNIKLTNNNCREAQKYLAAAVKIAVEDQAYESAVKEIANGFDALSNGRDLLQKLAESVNNLEQYRLRWPGAEKWAQRMINDNKDKVSSYGSYSSSARSDFDSAKDHLAKARREAAGRYFESAVKDANEAHRLADGTGAKARRAYDDDQASSSFDSSSSFGSSSDSSSSFGGGGSSYSGGGGASDGGGYGGGGGGGASDGGGW